ncbi:MAG TPA: DUF4384 domain-containing protein [Blastocatellia bacterium]|nr:DUF4384 domain-containing protein [Blastocatellia bacterium]
MKPTYFSGAVVIALWICLAPVTPAQGPDDDEVMRSFVATRDQVVTRPDRSRLQTQARRPGPIGLGCTLFKRGPHGNAERVSLKHEFHAGDAVRLVIESNITGYLYVFHVENDGPVKMLFPDARLQRGRNFIQAHTPKAIPSGREEDPEFRWLHFNQTVAIERFYLLVTRERLPEVLTGEELVAYCRDNTDGCPWRPSAAQWKSLLASADSAARESQSRKSDRSQTSITRDRITRDVGLPPGAPSPARVKMNISPQAGLLLMNVDLIHK